MNFIFKIKTILLICLCSIIFLIIVSCEGCSRYGVSERAEKNSREYSIPDEITVKQPSIEDDNIKSINTNPSNLTLQELFKKYKSAVFMITTSDGTDGKQGSGFFITPEGIGISNYHVFEGTSKGLEQIKLASGEILKISTVLLTNKDEDYIIFQVDYGMGVNFFNVAPDLPEIGDEVFAIGNPKGLEHTLSIGIVSQYRGDNKELIQTTAEITHGSSGGPLLNMKGEVIGITTAGLGEANLNFAININKLPLENIIKKKSSLVNNNKFNSTIDLYPTSTTGQIIEHNYFNVSYNEEHEQAEWVAYKVTENNFKRNIERTNDYRYDPLVKTGSATIFDYKKSGYDMGHLAPAKVMSFNHTSMSESFLLSNISPQVASFNRGIWKTLEGKIRFWAGTYDSIYVVTGPILINPITRIGENNVSVPNAFYKTLLGFRNGSVYGIAFIIPNEESDKSIYNYTVSIDDVELITGIDFYFDLESNIQIEVEKNKSLKIWGLPN